MKSIGARLAFSYACAATVTLAVMLGAGYYLLQSHLIHGLDLLNEAEFEQIKAHLGQDYSTLSPAVIDARIRETTEYASVLFFITIDKPTAGVGTIFLSRNLHGRALPDVKGKRTFTAELAGVGELRIGEFILGNFDVTVATPVERILEVMEEYRRVCLLLMALTAATSASVGMLFSRLALRPLRLIRETANRIRADNLGERIPVAAVQDEISDLARLLNQMFDRLEIAFDQVRRFSAEASHELKTPLSLVRLQAEKLLLQGSLKPADEEAVVVLLEEVGRLSQIIEELLFLSRADAQGISLPIALGDPMLLLRSFAPDARALAEHRGMRFEFAHSGDGLVDYEPRWLRRALVNLLANALEASLAGGLVTLQSSLDEHRWRLVMTDQGPGVSVEDRERIFERFVRLPHRDRDGDSDGSSGSGLGLAICKSIANLHRGRIYAESGPGGVGLSVVLEIPRRRDSATAAISAPVSAALAVE